MMLSLLGSSKLIRAKGLVLAKPSQGNIIYITCVVIILLTYDIFCNYVILLMYYRRNTAKKMKCPVGITYVRKAYVVLSNVTDVKYFCRKILDGEYSPKEATAMMKQYKKVENIKNAVLPCLGCTTVEDAKKKFPMFAGTSLTKLADSILQKSQMPTKLTDDEADAASKMSKVL
jgi:hypothetical protein